MLPAPVESTIQSRTGHGHLYDVGISEMHGHRISMEDNHLVVFGESIGFFGVLDGHGGRKCADFVASYMKEELQGGAMPKNGDDLHSLIMRTDAAFLQQDVVVGGSTGTFALVLRDEADASKCTLVVANVGDSRVLRGSIDGTMFHGPGTHGALTTDHKPDLPVEKERILNAGGQVGTPIVGGPPRVNNILALSRAFGDSYLKIGGKTEELHCVIAKPEIGCFSCSDSEFLVLACDGVFDVLENSRVVKIVADCIAQGKGESTPDCCAGKVVQEAFLKGSRDNISCMVVFLKRESECHNRKTLIPGPFHVFPHSESAPCRFRTAYAEVAKRAGLSLSEAIAMRYRRLLEMRATGDSCAKEFAMFGDGPSANSDAYAQREWFEQWLLKGSENIAFVKIEEVEHACVDCSMVSDSCIQDPLDDSWICNRCWKDVHNMPDGPEEELNEEKHHEKESQQSFAIRSALQVDIADYISQEEIGALSEIWQSGVHVGYKTGIGEFIGRGCKPSVQIVFDRKGINGFTRGPDPFAILRSTGANTDSESPPKKVLRTS